MEPDQFTPFEPDDEELKKQFWPDADIPGEKTGTKPNGAAAEWPEPLVAPGEAEARYPINALPKLLRDAILEYQKYGQQPLAMIATSVLASTSLVTQGLANIARDEHLVGPLSLYSIDIAVSGERKTSVDKVSRRAARDWMMAKCVELQPLVDQAAAEAAAWKARREGLLARIRSAGGKRAVKEKEKEKAESVADLQQELIQLEQSKPASVIVPRLFYEDINSPTLAPDLAEDWPSASLWSDEGGLVIGGHGMSDDMAMGYIALLNRLWDGNPFDRDRTSVRRARLRGRRFTVNLMVQPLVMARLLSLAGGASRGMGLIARFLLSWPTSTIGTRKYRPPEEAMNQAIRRLRVRLKELLDMPLPLDPENPAPMALAPHVLQMTPRARQIWRRFHDDVEDELGKAGEFADVADIGAKVAENAARIAGNFHVLVYGPGGEVDSKEIYCGAQVAYWYLCEARRVLAAYERPLALSDAEILLKWLLKQSVDVVNPRQILRVGPKALGRDKKRRDEAISVLLDHKYLLPHPGTMNGGRRYRLNPRAREEKPADQKGSVDGPHIVGHD